MYKKFEHAGQRHWDEVFYQVGKAFSGMKVINFLAWLSLVTMGRFAWKANRDKQEGDICPVLHHLAA